MIAQRQDVAQDADLDPAGFLAQRGGDQVRRRHGAVCAVVVLVEDDAVEAELLAVGHLFEMLAVVASALHRVEKVARHRRARGLWRNMGVREQVKIIDSHALFSPGKF